MKQKILLFSLALFLFSCSNDDKIKTETETETELSQENEITLFEISQNGNYFYGDINNLNKTISIYVGEINLAVPIVPNISISEGATISPDPSIAQNFSEVVNYTVTAENGDESIYEITATTDYDEPSSEKKILSFQLYLDGLMGAIDQENLTITIETEQEPLNIAPIITISEGATISPDPNEPQDFYSPVEYTVTAEDGSSNTYTVFAKYFTINRVSSFNYGSINRTKYFKNAEPYVSAFNVDLTDPNSSLILENATQSYDLTYSEYNSNIFLENNLYSNFKIKFPNNIISGLYKLKYIVNGEVKAKTNFNIDVLAEDPPVVNSANQSIYSYGDTLILEGSNLVPGIALRSGATIYIYNSQYVNVNSEKTVLTFPLTVNMSMFPSMTGGNDPRNIPIFIYQNGRYGDRIDVQFY